MFLSFLVWSVLAIFDKSEGPADTGGSLCSGSWDSNLSMFESLKNLLPLQYGKQFRQNYF